MISFLIHTTQPSVQLTVHRGNKQTRVCFANIKKLSKLSIPDGFINFVVLTKDSSFIVLEYRERGKFVSVCNMQSEYTTILFNLNLSFIKLLHLLIYHAEERTELNYALERREILNKCI